MLRPDARRFASLPPEFGPQWPFFLIEQNPLSRFIGQMRSAFSPLLAILAFVGRIFAADITPNAAAKHAGETVGVKGAAVEVFLSKGGNACLSFGAAFPN